MTRDEERIRRDRLCSGVYHTLLMTNLDEAVSYDFSVVYKIYMELTKVF